MLRMYVTYGFCLLFFFFDENIAWYYPKPFFIDSFWKFSMNDVEIFLCLEERWLAVLKQVL